MACIAPVAGLVRASAIAGLLAAGLASSGRAAEAPRPFDLDDSRFRSCERLGTDAQIVLRQALWAHVPREKTLEHVGADEDERRMVDEIYDEVERSGSAHYTALALKQFDACMAKVGLPQDAARTARGMCFVRQDVSMLAFIARDQQLSLQDAASRVKKALAANPRDLFPDDAVERQVARAYTARPREDDRLVFQFELESCMFPEAFQAWHTAHPDEAKAFDRLLGLEHPNRASAVQATLAGVDACAPARPMSTPLSPVPPRDDAVLVVEIIEPEHLALPADRALAARGADDFANAVATRLCAAGRPVTLVVDARPAIGFRLKFAAAAAAYQARKVLLVQAYGEPYRDADSRRISLTAQDLVMTLTGEDATMEEADDRAWPLWSAVTGEAPVPAATLGREFMQALERRHW